MLLRSARRSRVTVSVSRRACSTAGSVLPVAESGTCGDDGMADSVSPGAGRSGGRFGVRGRAWPRLLAAPSGVPPRAPWQASVRGTVRAMERDPS
nr:hypothetical protein KitaXyl93_17480 [Kitasatospora sp. Xyl93]